MDPASINEESIFLRALEKNTPRERASFLDGACTGDPRLRRRIEALLDSHEHAGEFLIQPPADVHEVCGPGLNTPTPVVSTGPITEGPRTTIGRYKLLEEIGEGGFGVVYMAEQREPVERRVALKIIKLGMDTRQVIGRFEAERQALAMMDHPNIAKVLDAGSTETGRPYFVMELVKGIPITEFCDQNRLDTRQRLELFMQVCAAVQHAHQKAIIHRDLKPSNVMVTLHDDRPVPKVIDFGVAKATQHRLTEKTVFTEFRQLIGTPAYMSPEQATFSGLDIDRGHANSIQSVRFSPDGKRLATASMDATVKLWDVGPRRPTFLSEPSGMVTSVAYFPQGNRLISASGDTEKGEGKLELWDPATGERLDTFEVSYDLLSVAVSPDGRTVAAGTRGGDVILWDSAAREQVRVLEGHEDAVWSVAVSPDGATVASASHDFSVKLWDVDSGELQDTFERKGLPFEGVAFSPDGKILAAGNFDSTINLWNVETRERKVLKGHAGIGFGLTFSPDGKTLASGGMDGKIILWDLSGGQQGAGAQRSVELPGHAGSAWGLAFSPDGKTLASAGDEGTVKLWDVVKHEVRANFKEHKTQVGSVAFSPDGHTLMSCSRDGEIILRRAATQAEVKAAGW